MKKLMSYQLLFVLLMGLAFACKSETEEPASRTDLLTGKDWRLTGATISPAIFGLSNVYSFIEDCESDDLYRFAADKTLNVDEGATKCNPSDPQTQNNGTWAFNADETQLSFTFNNANINGTITQLTGNTLQLTTNAAALATILAIPTTVPPGTTLTLTFSIP